MCDPGNGATPFLRDLDAPLLWLGPYSVHTQRTAMEGVSGYGVTGGGKSSGPAKALATAHLRAGHGGLVCITKPEDRDLWIRLARANGREQDLVIFRATSGYNFLSHELARGGPQALGNATECLMNVLEMSDRAMGAGGQSSEDRFWPASQRLLLNKTLPILYAADGQVTVSGIVQFVTSAGTKPEQYLDSAFLARSFAAQTIVRADKSPAVRLPVNELKALIDFWVHEYTAIPEKTRGNQVISLSAPLDRFRSGRMKSCFCDRTTILPEFAFQGGIILLDMAVSDWKEDGKLGQVIFKHGFERAVEARNGLDPSQRERPVFLFCDEAQNFASLKDEEFLSVCRSSRCCVIYLTQNISAYYARFGQGQTDAADALIGKFGTTVFNVNSCFRTNQHASNLIGRGLQSRRTTGHSTGTNTSRGMNEGSNTNKGTSSNYGSSTGSGQASWNSGSGDSSGSGENWGVNIGKGTNESRNYSEAEQMDNILEPNYFATALKSGGPKHNGLVTAIWVKAGASYRETGGANWLKVTFRQ